MNTQELYPYFKKCKGVSTDTRNIGAGSLFFALKGSNFDGNDFALNALELGAQYAVVDRLELSEKSSNILWVPDVLKALQALAHHHRKVLKTPLIAITGSNGKTTTKELFKKVLQSHYKVLATQGNLNNHIGVPLTLLRLSKATEIGVIEMGANHKGEIRDLCEIAAPDWGYITNFGKAHLEGFGSIEGVIQGKSELFNYLKASHGKVLINGDDPIQTPFRAASASVSFGKNKSCDYVFSEVPTTTKELILKNEDTLYHSSLYGSYNIPNIEAAISIGKIFNIPDTSIQEAIKAYRSENNRSQIITKGNLNIVLDAYNANPSSMKAALDTFLSTGGKNKDVILGDMLELGNFSSLEHQTVIDRCIASKLKSIITVGECFFNTHTDDVRVHKFKSTQALMDYLKRNPLSSKQVLIKGSRGIALEKVITVI